jgi:hypothetical protein
MGASWFVHIPSSARRRRAGRSAAAQSGASCSKVIVPMGWPATPSYPTPSARWGTSGSLPSIRAFSSTMRSFKTAHSPVPAARHVSTAAGELEEVDRLELSADKVHLPLNIGCVPPGCCVRFGVRQAMG